ncbi:MAG: hypothetical protein JSW27_05185 [Phycisphaerales bacterium]|nr:MAG: hypothetical protein JSW27_05185 [Phycisphaerales bacterium]
MQCFARRRCQLLVVPVLAGWALAAGADRAPPSRGPEVQDKPGTTSGAPNLAERITVAGVALDKHSGQGVSGVRVHFVGAPRDDGITAADGRFSTVTDRGRFGQWLLIFPGEHRSDRRIVRVRIPSDIDPEHAGRLELHVAPEDVPTQRQVRRPARQSRPPYSLEWDDQRSGVLCDRVDCVVCGTSANDGNRDNGSVAPTVYEKDLRAFFAEIDGRYPFFDLKGIRAAWAQVKPTLLARARECASDEAFLGIVVDAIRVLRDGHLGVAQAKVKLPAWPVRHYPGVSFLPATNGRVVVMYAPKDLAKTLATGTVVTKIDGVDARRFLERRSAEAWDAGGFFSSPQRARLFEYRIALRGEQGQEHTIRYLNNGEERSVTVESETAARGWPHTYNLPGDLKRVGRSFFYTKLADDVGYMYLRRVDTSVPGGIDEALQAHPKLKGWIVDLRGNGGGGYDRALIDRIKSFPRPVAVLIDAGCVSAAETLARDFRRYAKARLFGSVSGGSSSSKKTWSFPSGIASIRFPVRSRWRSDGEPIEFNGIEPDVEAEAVPEELKAGYNSTILRAQ